MSKLPFELLLALRYLRPKRTFVSIITLISVLGVALGVAVLIIVISVMSGFDHDLREKILGFNAHLKISRSIKPASAKTMDNYADVMRLVSSNKNVRGVSPFVLGQVLVETEPADTNAQQSLTAAPWIRGVDADAESSVSVLPKSIIAGSFDLSGRGLIDRNRFRAKHETVRGRPRGDFLARRLEKNAGELWQARRGGHFARRLHRDGHFRRGLL